MRNRVVLLPGWGLGTAPLEPLAAALHDLDEHLRVQLEPLPELTSSDPQQWLDELDANLPEDCWLAGWSLGGMLATALAERRGERCCGLLTLASNPCFVAREDWPAAMPVETFQAFQQGFQTDSAATLKRFALLCAQGAEDSRSLGRSLAASAPQGRNEALRSGLELLATLDNRKALQQFRGPQLHLLGSADALVPPTLADALLALQPDIEIAVIESACHAFARQRPHAVALAMQAFFNEAHDD